MDSKGVYCGNLSSRVTEELIYELFLQAGPIENVIVPKDSSGYLRGYALVFFKHDCSVEYSINLLRGTRLFDRELDLRPRNRGTNGEGTRSVAGSSSFPALVPYGLIPQPAFFPFPVTQDFQAQGFVISNEKRSNKFYASQDNDRYSSSQREREEHRSLRSRDYDRESSRDRNHRSSFRDDRRYEPHNTANHRSGYTRSSYR